VFDIVPQLIANSVIAGSLYALVAMSFSLIYGTTKFFNLAHGVLAAIGGYTVYYLGRKVGLDLYIVLPAGVLLAALVGFALEKFLYQPLRARKASSMVLLVASLGAFTALQAIVAIFFTSQFQTLSALIPNAGVVHIGDAVMTEVQVVILTLSVLVLLGLTLMLKRTTFGRAVSAVSDDEEVAKIVGINTNKIIGRVFIIGSAIAGAAGILVGFDTGLEPTMGLALLLKGVIAAIIGGVGSISGAFLGAFLLGFAENFGIWHISGEWKDAIAFGILIIFLLVRPQGILGKK
jgi:branched-chain amino acid transport system permease protein